MNGINKEDHDPMIDRPHKLELKKHQTHHGKAL